MDRYWLEITIETVPVLAEMSGEILLEAGCGGVICQDPPPGETGLSTRSYRVTGYLPLQDGCDRKIEEIKEHLAALDRFFPPGPDEPHPRARVLLRRIKEEKWGENWKKHFQPQFIGAVIITPPWHEITAAPGQVVVKIEPGMAFGTGTHPSTVLSLRLLQEVIRGGETVYDIGTGSGILALAAAGLGAAPGVRLAPEVQTRLAAYPWPGNLRQYASALRTALALLDAGELVVDWQHLPDDLMDAVRHSPAVPAPAAVAGEKKLADISRAAIQQAVQDSRGNLSAAARQLGISRQTLYRKLH